VEGVRAEAEVMEEDEEEEMVDEMGGVEEIAAEAGVKAEGGLEIPFEGRKSYMNSVIVISLQYIRNTL
jgi:hypothetical protein